MKKHLPHFIEAPFITAFYCIALVVVYMGDFIAAMYHKLRPVKNDGSCSDFESGQE